MWKTTKIGNVCDIRSGNSIPVKEKESLYKNASDGLPYVATKDIGFDGIINYQNGVRIPIKYSSKFKISKKNSTFLCGEGGSAGKKIAFSTEDCHFVNKLFSITPGKEIAPKYLYYYTLSNRFKTQFKKAIHGLIGGVSLLKIKNFEISYPSLEDQKKIVNKIDKIFDSIEKEIFSSEKQLQNTQMLYQTSIDSILRKETDKKILLGSFSNINYGYTTKASHQKGSYKIIRITDIQDGKVDWKNVPLCEVKKDKLKNVLLHDGDIVFARTGATTGKSYIVKNPKNTVFASYLIRLSVDKNRFLPKFIYHYFQSSSYWQQINEGITGSAQGGFNASKLKNLQIPFIDMGKQENLTIKLNEIFSKTEELKNLYQAKIENLINLKLSILQQEYN